MLELTQLVRGLQWLSLGAILALIVRLGWEKLHRIYPCFFAYLIFEAARSLAVLPLKPSRTLYGTIYIATEPIVWVLYFMIVRELYTLVLKEHPGLATAGSYTLTAAILAAAAISLVTLGPDLNNQGGPYPVLHRVNVLSRVITTTLVFFLLSITAFLAWFPVPLNRNTIVYCLGYSAFFISKTLSLLARNVVGPEAALWASATNLLVANLCLAVWIWKLNAAGEHTEVVIGHRWRQEEADGLIQQLNNINDSLARGTRR
ncbi:MAG: hypothetical protein JJE04_00080 [Acidobacteriia bacterium]|nr:hypothetical protein [Terriglobia bacterium]